MIRIVDNGFLVVGAAKSNDGQVTGHHGSTDSADAWVVKISADGNLEWQKSYGGTGDDGFRSVITLSDGNYLCVGYAAANNGGVSGFDPPLGGGHESDMWLLKVNVQIEAWYGRSASAGIGTIMGQTCRK